MSEDKQAYITKVHLKGYKSIKDLEIDFKPGLNIIIGPNGSGKTNFLEFVNNAFHLVVKESKIEVHGSINFVKNGNNLKLKYDVVPNIRIKDAQDVSIIISEQDEKVIFENQYLKVANKEIYNNGISNYSFGYGMLMLEFEAKRLNLIVDLIDYGVNIKFNDFFADIAINIELNNKEVYSHNQTNLNSLFHIIENTNFNENYTKIKNIPVKSTFIDILKTYSPITDLRFNIDNAKISQGTLGNDAEPQYDFFEIQNIRIEFWIKQKWLNWSMLSDGTKRIFYILYSLFVFKTSTIFLEEPELGIHPAQLQKLMQFLKEQAKEKQIIITTHSPEVLNILNEDELDQIIVTRYDAENGTKMYKLSEKEQSHVRNYMKHQATISDYWIQSGFEKENEEVDI